MKTHQPVKTSNFKKINKLAKYVIEEKALGCIIANAGYGKTITLQHIQNNFGNIKYYRVGLGEPAKPFYGRLVYDFMENTDIDLDKLLRGSYISYLVEKVSFFINEKNDIDLILIDEFGNFNSRYIPFIRQLWDNVRSRTGILLAGTEAIKMNLKKWDIENRPGINEFRSRIGSRMVTLKKHTKNDTKLVCRSRGITNDHEVNYFHLKCESLRVLQDLITDYKAGLFSIN